mgnify:CR=1 FL=1
MWFSAWLHSDIDQTILRSVIFNCILKGNWETILSDYVMKTSEQVLF